MADGKNGSGRVEEIWIAQSAGREPVRRSEARLLAGVGIEGDRYASGEGTWARPGMWSEITLISAETLASLDAVGKAPDPGAHRRNLVVAGVVLDDLIGRSFRVGSAVLEGDRRCDPCGYLERKTGIDGLKEALAERGGLRARIVVGGTVREGDGVERTI